MKNIVRVLGVIWIIMIVAVVTTMHRNEINSCKEKQIELVETIGNIYRSIGNWDVEEGKKTINHIKSLEIARKRMSVIRKEIDDNEKENSELWKKYNLELDWTKLVKQAIGSWFWLK